MSCPLIPSELIMPLAGFLTAQGSLSFVGVVLAGMAGSVLGALPLYYAGRLQGEARVKAWADAYGAWLTVSGAEIERAKGWFALYRFLPSLRHYSNAVIFIDRNE